MKTESLESGELAKDSGIFYERTRRRLKKSRQGAGVTTNCKAWSQWETDGPAVAQFPN